MFTPNLEMARQIAEAASSVELERTGHLPSSVTVVLSDDILVVTLHEALTRAERVLAKTSVGAAQVQEFHRQLFTNSADPLRLEINRISGRLVREAAADIEPRTGSVVHALTTGTMVQVFLLTKSTSLTNGDNSETSEQS